MNSLNMIHRSTPNIRERYGLAASRDSRGRIVPHDPVTPDIVGAAILGIEEKGKDAQRKKPPRTAIRERQENNYSRPV